MFSTFMEIVQLTVFSWYKIAKICGYNINKKDASTQRKYKGRYRHTDQCLLQEAQLTNLSLFVS